MEEILNIDNTNILTLTGECKGYAVKNAKAYLFGFDTTRRPIAVFEKGELIPDFKKGKVYTFIVSGVSGTELQKIQNEDDLPDYKEKFEATLRKIAKNLLIDDYDTGNFEFEMETSFRLIFHDELVQNLEHVQIQNRVYENSIKKFNILDRGESKDDAKATDFTEGNLLNSVKLICRKIGVDFKPVRGKIYSDSEDGLQELAKDLNIRIRKVLLRDEWYNEDTGPLLAYYSDSDDADITSEKPGSADGFKPGALIPVKPGKYVLAKPDSGEKMKVTKKTARKFHPAAFMFYRPLPNHRLRIKDLVRYFLPEIKSDAVFFILLGFFASLIGLLVPKMSQMFIDDIIPRALRTQAVEVAVLVLLCTFASTLANLVKGFSMLRIEFKTDSGLQAAMVDRILRLPTEFFKKYSSGDLGTRTLAISEIRKQISGIIVNSLMQFVFSLVYVAQIFIYSAQFAKWAVLLCIIPIVVCVVCSYFCYKAQKDLHDMSGKLTGKMMQFVMGIEKIINSNSGKRVFCEWGETYLKKTKMQYKSGKIMNFIQIFNAVYPILASMFLYGIFIRGLKNGSIEALSTGAFFAFLTAYTSFQTVLLMMTNSLISSVSIIPMFNRCRPVFDAEPEVNETKHSVRSLNGDIEISHLNFRYSKDTPFILNDVSIHIEKGQFVALVGGSGAGKSTLLRLLLGFEKAESGGIFYDGKDINSVDIGSLRRCLGVVLQNDNVMSGTVMQNIVGSSGLSMEDAWRAARMVGFDKDIEMMPMGMHTLIQAGGGTLSGGQKQRLIIARALVRNPNIIFLDEATSALDNKTQSIVRESMDKLKVTRVVVAHRLSTIINADVIYVFDKGRIVESGNYEELMKKGGVFYELAKRQI